jgi:hypothetical protein
MRARNDVLFVSWSSYRNVSTSLLLSFNTIMSMELNISAKICVSCAPNKSNMNLFVILCQSPNVCIFHCIHDFFSPDGEGNFQSYIEVIVSCTGRLSFT